MVYSLFRVIFLFLSIEPFRVVGADHRVCLGDHPLKGEVSQGVISTHPTSRVRSKAVQNPSLRDTLTLQGFWVGLTQASTKQT